MNIGIFFNGLQAFYPLHKNKHSASKIEPTYGKALIIIIWHV
jgi:hypothetical protein